MSTAFYRNKQDLLSDQGVSIDKGSLWERKENESLTLTLVDEDEHHTHEYVVELFEPEVC